MFRKTIFFKQIHDLTYSTHSLLSNSNSQREHWVFHKRHQCKGAKFRWGANDTFPATPKTSAWYKTPASKAAIPHRMGDPSIKTTMDQHKEFILTVMPQVGQMGSLNNVADGRYMGEMLKAAELYYSEDWWLPATSGKPDRVYRFFLDDYRLRIEDHYVTNCDLEALYAERAGSSGASMSYFHRYIKDSKKKGKGVYPSWWNESHHSKVLERALNADDYYSIQSAVEQADLAKQWGREMCVVMRSLATRIEGEYPS